MQLITETLYFYTMFSAERISYSETNSFSKIVRDYLDGNENLRSFYSFPPSPDGIEKAVYQKSKQNIDRDILVAVLKNQYLDINSEAAVLSNIEKLLSPVTYTICTAHQPNLFTGPLYFIYKILHAIKLAAHLKQQRGNYDFVPVFYMGSEDADLAELDHFTVQGKRYQWKTGQQGAVGRMTVDNELVKLITGLENQLGVEPHGKEFTSLLKKYFTPGSTIQNSTFQLVNALFGKYGLVVLIADDARLKKQMLPVFEDDLLTHEPAVNVAASCKKLEENYDVQANPRDINLFYLKDNIRERIEEKNGQYSVVNTKLTFSKDEILNELKAHPERFSPNVILRGLFQETILPNIAFIGGGGEIAYWLQLKSVFDHYQVPFPVLVLRNSFLIVEKRHTAAIEKLKLSIRELFLPGREMLDILLDREGKKPKLNGELSELETVFQKLKQQASTIDPTLKQHVDALHAKASNGLLTLEKKMMRAERKKHEALQRQIEKLKRELFPGNGLQERVENFSFYYSEFGADLIAALLQHSLSLEQEFTVLSEKN
jgi:bacillithiol synthase